MRRLLGSLIRLATIPMNRLKILPYTANFGNPKDIVNVELMKAQDDIIKADDNASIAALMARMGLVIIPTNIALTGFPNPITVNGRNYTLVNKQRVLLTNQTTTSENGVYEVSGTNLVRINDLQALDGITLSTNQIGLKRWVNAANALNFNGSGEAQVRVKNTGPDIFGGWGVDPVTGELFITNSALPGASVSLTIENFLGTVLGFAAKMQFSNDFLPVWDGANSRITVGLNKNIGQNVTEDFVYKSVTTATDESNVGRRTMARSGLVYIDSNINPLSSFITDVSVNGVFGVAQRSIPNSAAIWEGIMAVSAQADFRLVASTRLVWREKLRFVSGTLPSGYTSTNQIHFRSGFLSLVDVYTTSGQPNDGIYFYLAGDENSGRLLAVAANGGTRTKTDTGITISSSVYYILETRWAGTNAQFFVNGNLVATISTNLPATSTYLVPCSKLRKGNASAQGAIWTINTDFVDFSYE